MENIIIVFRSIFIFAFYDFDIIYYIKKYNFIFYKVKNDTNQEYRKSENIESWWRPNTVSKFFAASSAGTMGSSGGNDAEC